MPEGRGRISMDARGAELYEWEGVVGECLRGWFTIGVFGAAMALVAEWIVYFRAFSAVEFWRFTGVQGFYLVCSSHFTNREVRLSRA
jgi:hypothetical protein